MIWHLNNTLTRFGNWRLKIFCRLIIQTYKHQDYFIWQRALIISLKVFWTGLLLDRTVYRKTLVLVNKLQRFRLSNFDNIKRFLKHKVSQGKDCVYGGVRARVLGHQSLKPGRETVLTIVRIMRVVSKENVLAGGKLSLPVTHRVRVHSQALYVAHVGLKE